MSNCSAGSNGCPPTPDFELTPAPCFPKGGAEKTGDIKLTQTGAVAFEIDVSSSNFGVGLARIFHQSLDYRLESVLGR